MKVYIVKIFWMSDVATPEIKVVADTDEETLWKTLFRMCHRIFDWETFEKNDLENIEKSLFAGQYKDVFYKCISADKFKMMMTVKVNVLEVIEPVIESMNYCQECHEMFRAKFADTHNKVVVLK